MLLLVFSVALTYDLSAYRHCVDADGDKQDSRQEILIRDSHIAITCRAYRKVQFGLWVCPCTGPVNTSPRNLNIDHLVVLGEIDAAGAHSWAAERRDTFVNDPDNLVAVYKRSNRSKGDKDAYLWLPPNIANCSWYLHAREEVWRKYKIAIDSDE